jgi:hypothetical protein
MESVDRALLATLGETVLRPAIVNAVTDGVFAELRREKLPATHERLGRSCKPSRPTCNG